MDIASVRIFRMSFATAICMLVSQIYAWPMSFIAPIITMFILALPLPAMGLKGAIKFFIVFAVALYGALVLLPFIVYYRMAGLLLVSLALFHSFYFTARGGSPILGNLATMGITLVTAVGSVSIDMTLSLISGLLVGISVGLVFVWIGFAVFPDSMAKAPDGPKPEPPPPPPKPSLESARYSAFRSLLIVLPILIWFLFSGASASYFVVMIKVASMGQQASLDKTRDAANSLLYSTIIGGVGAIICWQLMGIWPSLVLYTLLIGASGLIIGPRIFQGLGMSPAGPTWSYGFLTLIVILAPAVLDGQFGSSVDSAFWSRFFLLVGTSLYGVVAVWFFDLFSHDRAASPVTDPKPTAP